jgi:zinc transport system substrate-binding protein
MLQVILAFALTVVLASGHALAEAPKVVVTVKPVHALVAGVMEGVGEPRLLVPAAASEHSFSLKPSDAKALQSADLVFWVGEGLESFLARPLAALSARARVVALSQARGMTLLPHRAGGSWEEHEDDHGHADDHGQAAADGEADMHIWLDPDNAARIIAVAADALAAADPGNAARYVENARQAQQRIAALDVELTAIFAPVREQPFIVFHDAYQYLERRFGLHAVGSVTVSPERKPSAKRMHEIRLKILELKAACVFSEPQFDEGLVRAVIGGTPARTAALDHLGVGVPDGLAGYAEMMRGLARTIAGCLDPPR